MNGQTQILLGPAFMGTLILLVWLHFHWRQRRLLAFYKSRHICYKDWIARYGKTSRAEVQAFLRCFADSFFVPSSIVHKLAPDDPVMAYYHRDYRRGEPDCLEVETFAAELERVFGYKVETSDGTLSLARLFEKATGRKSTQNVTLT